MIKTRVVSGIPIIATLVVSLIFMAGCTHGVKKTGHNRYLGKASYYADKYHGRKTANGEIYHKNKLTCAHKKLPFGTICKVTNLANGKSVKVRVNDRGPFVKGRIVDLSYKAMKIVDGLKAGVIEVELEIVQ